MPGARAAGSGIATKGSAKYAQQCWAGLVDDPAEVARERARRAAAVREGRPREIGR